MGIFNGVKDQFRSIIQWEQPVEWEIFRKYTAGSDELKHASKLILQPGQGCLFTHEGKTEVFSEAGMHDLTTGNKPFLTTLKKFLYLFESEHKTALWFYRTADIANIRWGTRMPITYNDPVYSFPVNLRAYGNFSIRIAQPAEFFTRIVAGEKVYYATDLQELLMSRISQPIGHYLANAKFSYAEVDANLEPIARDAAARTAQEYEQLGFSLLDFRIEGSSFDEATNKRIAGISDIQAEVKAAQLAGVSFEELQKLIAMRDAAKNEGTTGALFAAANIGNVTPSAGGDTAGNTLKSKLKALKELFDEGLLDEEEYKQKKQELMKEL